MALDGIVMVQQDDCRINMSDPWQVLWWCSYFGLTKTELESVIRIIGSQVVDIKHYLGTYDDLLRPIQAPPPPSHIAGSAKGSGFSF